MKARLTTHGIAAAVCPPGKREAAIWDAACPGLAVRLYRTGGKVWAVSYRPGKGRGVAARWFRLGSVDQLGPAEARLLARKFLGELAAGVNPAAKAAAGRAEAKAAQQATLGAAIDAYAAELARRRIVKASEVISILRRELRDPLGAATDLRTITRRQLVDRIEAVATDRPGAAGYLRKASTGLLEWLANRGAIAVSPLAGFRKPRRSRAELIDQPGRALADGEITALWRGTDSRFGALVRLCLLTGARRGEAAAMRWRDIDLDARTWVIRAEVAKTGRARTVWLAPLAVAVLRGVVRLDGDLVFPSDAATPISGWSKRVAAAAKTAGVDFTMHDLRRTYRTGLSRLGVDRDTAELCLGHWRGDLVEAYDRDGAEERQRRAVERWARHVEALATGEPGRVVPLRALA